MQNLEAFKQLLQSPRRIIITTHFNPDADALGSSLGLSSYLKKKGHQVHVITPSGYPDFLAWIGGNDDVIVYNEQSAKEVKTLIAGADVIFCLDFGSLKRVHDMEEPIRNSKAKKVLIDHHLEPEQFADFTMWSTAAAATAELIFQLIELMGDKHLIDTEIAEALYAGIMTDTGSFRHPNTSERVHLITAELIKMGADTAKVGKLVYDNNSVGRLKFLGFALSQKLKVLKKYKTAYFAISEEELAQFSCKSGDTEGLVNYALSIEDIVLAAVIMKKEGSVKISFRSVGDFPVNEFAKNHFEGGGHKNAAGGKSDLGLEETVEKFESLLSLYKEQLNKTNQLIN